MDQTPYSVPVGEKRPGQSHVYRNPAAVNGLPKPPATHISMQDVWSLSVTKNFKRKCLDDYTYREIDDLSRFFGSWLVVHEFKVLYIHTINRWEWTMMDIACLKFGIVSVPLYDTLGKEALEHTLGLTEGKCIAQSKAAAAALLKANPKNFSNITHIVQLDEFDPEVTAELKKRYITLVPLKDIFFRKILRPYPYLLPEDHLSYVFTSGTTGLPKGVIMTHGNIVSQLFSMTEQVPFTCEDVHLSYLPLQHSFQRIWVFGLLNNGAHIRYYSGAVTELVKDLARVRPTVMPIVPRLLNMFYSMLRSFPWVDQKTAADAWKAKLENWEKGILTSDYDEKVFKRIKDTFGGRLRYMVTGSAPIAAQVLQFFMVCLGCDIREGYGQTETSAATFLTRKGERKAGHVGGVTPCVEFKLVDIPEMNYTSNDKQPRGEICVRGAPIFPGYFKDKKNTDEAIDKEGWLHTGDVGMLEPNGALKIIDRKKNIYKLSQGEYIAPEKIENVYLRCPLVAECFVYGDSLQSFNVAVVVPNKDLLLKLAGEKGLKKTFEELCQDAAVNKLVLEKMLQQGKHDGLVGFEQVKKAKLHPVSFTVGGLVTSSMKLQRHLAKQAFQKQIAALYNSQ